MRVALVTCSLFPEGDLDDRELEQRFGGAEWVVWDDPEADWDAYGLAVVRSPWDYQGRRDEFVAWAERIPNLVNPAAVLRWNTDKRYLSELRAAGVPVVATDYVAPGEPFAAPDGSEYVLKPTVSGGSQLTARFGPGDEERAAALVAAIHAAGKTVMVQPYVASVDARGETALMFFGGEFSHAVCKGPLLEPGAEPTSEPFAAEDISPREPSRAEHHVAQAAIDAALAVPAIAAATAGDPLPYARADLVEDAGGSPRLLELEVTEPSLFFGHADGDAAARFARAALGAPRAEPRP